MSSDHLITLGWREWVELPELEIPAIKAKADTGARTSALHAFDVREFSEYEVERVEFKIHPRQRDIDTVITCKADVIDERVVTDSGRAMQILTIITVIFVPLTFLAGIYGMNFENMLELSTRTGYFVVIETMFVIAMMQLIYFRRKRWV